MIRNVIVKRFCENTEFGQKLKKFTRKTSQRKHGQPVYEVTEKCPEYGLKQGDYVYLDAKHRDHLEVFQSNQPRGVINLDGSQNIKKAEKALADNRKLP